MGRGGCGTSYVPDLMRSAKYRASTPLTTDVHDLTITQEKLRRSVERDALTDALSRHDVVVH